MISLALQVALNIVNLLATLTLVLVFDWGVAGIGAGTAIAEWVALIAGLFIIKPFGAHPAVRMKELLDGLALRRLVAVNRDIFLRSFFLLLCFGWFARSGAKEGDTILAANAILLNLHGFTSYGLDGFANATETLVGSVIGARQKKALAQVIKAAFVWSGLVAFLFSVVYAFAGSSIVSLLTDQEDVRTAAIALLPFLIALPLVSVTSFMLDGIMIGAMRARDMRNSMIISTCIFIATAYGLQQIWGNEGLWTAMMILMIARAVTLGLKLKETFAQV
jgi:multidrug resistance protein, MATE family